ncbi:hypothetical protein DYB34_010963 [Aphanomyces astaci]|uniref:Uncharacterized protein n=2 Tax=Aphanomyces astaci TaxID=112090 RepID=A0A3R7B398_APHAT|nr:hypothetical protein DYB34_010963 [Aphanomyces astaci]
MPQKPVAYAAEYEFPDENSVAMRRRKHSDAMHQEHMRTMQPPMKKDLTTVPVVKSPNKKKQQLVQDRQLSIATENEHLVDKMQRIMTRTDDCFHVQNSPIVKPSNQPFRQKIYSHIQKQNRAIKHHLHSVKGTYSTAQWKRGNERSVPQADEAERLSRQISKAPKRVKAKQGLKHIQHQPTKNHQDDPTPEFEFLVLNDIDEAVPMRTAKEIKEHIQSKLPLIHNKAVAYLAKEIKKPDPFHSKPKIFPESAKLTATCNPYLDFYRTFQKSQPKDMARLFDPDLDDDTREELFNLVDDKVAAVRSLLRSVAVHRATPGTGYWGRLLQLRGVDVKCFDLHVPGEECDDAGEDDDDDEEAEPERMTWLDVEQGTPEVLSRFKKRTLLLCYPDDYEDSEESMAEACLNNYTGEYVIHIGELFGHTLCLPEPW